MKSVRFYTRRTNRHKWVILAERPAEHLEACKLQGLAWRDNLDTKWLPQQMGYTLQEQRSGIMDWDELKRNDPAVTRFA